MYLEKKKINGEVYNYLKLSIRQGNKVRTKTVVYLGKDNLSKEHLKSLIAKYKTKEQKIKEETLKEFMSEEHKIIESFLSESEISKLEQIKSIFRKKINNLDKQTKQDMFNDFLVVYAYNTNAIEGNTLTLRETDLLLNKGITPEGKTLREINDHLNAKKVFDLILNNELEINHENIIRLHSLLMENIDQRVGAYRSFNVRVIGARFESTPAEFVKADMGILLKWFEKNQNKMHPLVTASIFHHKFEKIHPFCDGNGRTGRALLNLILLKNNLPPLVISDAQRKKYYEALSSADNADLTKIQPEHEKIVKFCYLSLLKTYNTIFNRWG